MFMPGQDKHHHPNFKHEIGSSIGSFPFSTSSYRSFNYANGLLFGHYSEISHGDISDRYIFIPEISAKLYKIGSFAVNYNCIRFKRHQFGGALSFVHLKTIVYEREKFRGMKTVYNDECWGLLAHYHFNYFNRNLINLSFGIHLGASMYFLTKTDSKSNHTS
jgi:hypothetical protein